MVETLKPLTDQAKNIISELGKSADSSKTIEQLANDSIIPQGIEIPKPDLIFAMDEIPLFTKKSLSTLIGKAKAGKTTCTAWIAAKIITGELTVLWIDTEQGDYYGSRTQFWILGIAKLEGSEHLFYSDLKEHNPDTRFKIIEYLITTKRPDLVIIDGIRDLVFDINAAEAATIMIGNLMRIATVNDCHILSILHQNKGNEHARGHLGSEMINKSETVIKVSQDENKIVICEPEFTRGKAFAPFAFDRDTYGVPILVNYHAKLNTGESNNQRGAMPIDIANATHFECLTRAYYNETELSYTDLLNAIIASFGYYSMRLGVVKAKGFISFYLQQNYLLKCEKVSNKQFYKINWARKEADNPLETREPTF